MQHYVKDKRDITDNCFKNDILFTHIDILNGKDEINNIDDGDEEDANHRAYIKIKKDNENIDEEIIVIHNKKFLQTYPNTSIDDEDIRNNINHPVSIIIKKDNETILCCLITKNVKDKSTAFVKLLVMMANKINEIIGGENKQEINIKSIIIPYLLCTNEKSVFYDNVNSFACDIYKKYAIQTIISNTID